MTKKPPRWVFVVVAVVGAAAACVLCLPATGWLLFTYHSPTARQYLVFAAANAIVAAVGSMPGVLGLAFYSGPKRPQKDGPP
jgi:hypothetical protein